MDRKSDSPSIVRIVLTDGASIIASCDGAEGLGGARQAMVTLTSEEMVERVPLASVAAILPWDSRLPMPPGTHVYRFAMFP